MSDVIAVNRPVYEVETVNGSFRFAAGTFSPTNLTYIAFVDPAKLLAHSLHTSGYKKQPIGKELQAYRFSRAVEQSQNHPAEMPSAGFQAAIPMYERDQAFTLYDAEFVSFLLEQGATEVPVTITTSSKDELDAFLKNLGATRPLLTLNQVNQDVYEGVAGAHNLICSDVEYTRFITIDELENMVKAHVSQLEFHESHPESDDGDIGDLYKNFSGSAALLDALITMGAEGADVDKWWDGLSIQEGMRAEVEKRKSQLEYEVPAIEKVDRFAKLYQRYDDYMKKPDFNKVIDPADESRIIRLCAHVAGMILADNDAVSLAKTELCEEAQFLLSGLIDERRFTPSPETAPKPAV